MEMVNDFGEVEISFLQGMENSEKTTKNTRRRKFSKVSMKKDILI